MREHAPDETDETLVAQAAAGDQRAFRILVERHMGRAIRVAQRVVGVAADADDIAQEAFLRVWTKATTFDPTRAKFSTWLYRIVLNLALDQRRRPTAEALDEADEIPSGEPGALALLAAAEEQRAMEAAIAALPPRQRAAIALFHMEGLSGRDAAHAMDLSEKAFESLLTRARAAVKAACRATTETGGCRDVR